MQPKIIVGTSLYKFAVGDLVKSETGLPFLEDCEEPQGITPFYPEGDLYPRGVIVEDRHDGTYAVMIRGQIGLMKSPGGPFYIG